MHTRKQWLIVCRLNEDDDVSNIYVCTRHFNLTDIKVTYKRINLHHDAIPSRAVLNPVIHIGN